MTDYALTVADLLFGFAGALSFGMAWVAGNAWLDDEPGRPGLWTFLFLLAAVLLIAVCIVLRSPAG